MSVETIPGWFDVRVGALFSHMTNWQRSRGVIGDVLEIGVFCGRSFVHLANTCLFGESAIAIDIFDQQDLNLSKSGHGRVDNIEHRFDTSVSTYVRKKVNVKKIKGSSSDFSPDQMVEETNRNPIRIFRVDGGHGYKEVRHDLLLAGSIICRHGLVFVDDVFNSSWPDVSAAVNQTISEGRLVPIAIWLGEVVMCRPCDYKACKQSWKGLAKHETKLWQGHEVAMYEKDRVT